LVAQAPDLPIGLVDGPKQITEARAFVDREAAAEALPEDIQITPSQQSYCDNRLAAHLAQTLL
jgi:hypothetical protein